MWKVYKQKWTEGQTHEDGHQAIRKAQVSYIYEVEHQKKQDGREISQEDQEQKSSEGPNVNEAEGWMQVECT